MIFFYFFKKIDAGTRLAKSGFGVYGIDYEGHGKSDGLQGYVNSFDALVDDCFDHYSKISGKYFLFFIRLNQSRIEKVDFYERNISYDQTQFYCQESNQI